MTQKQVLELEPNLNPVFDSGVIYESAMHARDPHGILKQIFKLFLKRVGNLSKQILRVWNKLKLMKLLLSQRARYTNLKNQVIVRSFFKKKLTDQLGENIPLDTERGYHVHFKGMDHLISRL